MASSPSGARIDLAFRRAEDTYAQLRAQYEAGSLSAEQFKAAVEGQRVEYGGRYWMLGVNSGRWYVYDGGGWQEADLPIIAEPPQAAPAGKAPQTQAAAATPAKTPAKKSAGIPEWVYALVASIVALLCWLHIAKVF